VTNSGALEDLSVVVTCFNKLEYVEPVFESLQEMAKLGAEIIMVDDGSTDGSSEALIQKQENSNYSFFLEKIENRGLAGARDYGITKSTKEFVFCLDIDDTPNIHNLAEFFGNFRESQAQIAQANFTFSETNSLGPITIRADNPVVFNTSDYRDEIFGARSWWRFLYRREFLMRPENRFNEVFLDLKGKSFVLDDIFWMLHLAAIDLNVYQSASTTSIYNYYLPEHNGEQRWRSYIRQITLLPEATILYVNSLNKHECNHDDFWLYRTLLKVLWDHSTLLSLGQFFKNSIQFLKAGTLISGKLGFKYRLLNMLYFLVAPLRIMKYRLAI
jgi:glycosyltransferase involved in cell wall biosynthesis